jgi:hypothetical protein
MTKEIRSALMQDFARVFKIVFAEAENLIQEM